VIKFHENSSASLIEDVTRIMGKAEVVSRPVKIYRDEQNNTWEERHKVKSDSLYYRNHNSGEKLQKKPEGLTYYREYLENYCSAFPSPSPWAPSKNTEKIKVNCFSVQIEKNLFRYEVLDLEEQSQKGVRWKLFPRNVDRKRSIRPFLVERFGKNHLFCDGFLLSAQPSDEKEFTYENKEDSHTVTFRNTGKVVWENIGSDDDKSPELEIQMLTYILSDCAKEAGVKRDDLGGIRGTVFWDPKQTDFEVIRQNGSEWRAPDVQLWRTYEARLRVGYDPREQQKQLFMNVDVGFKHIASCSLRDFIEDLARKDLSNDELKEKCEQLFNRKRCFVSYSSDWIQIEGFDFESDETMEFEGRGGTTSIKDYLKKVREVQGEIKKERCVVVCRTSGRYRKSAHYLPQHLYISITKEQTERVDSQIKDREAMDARTRMRDIQKFVDRFAEGQNSYGMTISKDPIAVEAYRFPDVKLELKCRRGEESYIPKEFTQNWRNCGGFMNKLDKEIQVGIIGDRNDCRDVENGLQRYMGKRGFRDYKIVGMAKLRDYTESEIKEQVQNLTSADVCICTIQDGPVGSKQKALIEKVCGQFKLKTQFLRSTNIRRNAAFLGMCDDAMAKCGGTWFKIDYRFDTLQAENFWVLGMDVYKST